MTIPVQIPDELAREATRRGLDVAAYIEQILIKELASAKPSLPPSPRLTKEELAECFAALAQYSDQIPDLPDSAFTREAIYADHD
jgi:post-segregation antitoxin (ccd killing protein)